MLRVIWLVAITACSGQPPPPAHPAPAATAGDAGVPSTAALEHDLAKLVERSLVMQRDVAAALAASNGDCAAAAARLGQLAGTYRDVVAANAKVFRDGRSQALRDAMEPHGAAFDDAAQAIMQSPTMASCAQDGAFAQAFDRLFEPPAEPAVAPPVAPPA